MRAARGALASLEEIRSLRYGGPEQEPAAIKPAEGEVRKGVVKLGFAWEVRRAAGARARGERESEGRARERGEGAGWTDWKRAARRVCGRAEPSCGERGRERGRERERELSLIHISEPTRRS
eukprot:1358759-Prymnesium_polylepis.1